MHEKLKASVEQSQIINRNGYPYFISPVSDGVPRMDPDILDEIIDWMISACDFDCDVIAAPESMGIPLAVPLSLRLRIPYIIIRKRSYGLADEVPVYYRTGYSERIMYINGFHAGDRVVLVDDVLSTGGTLSALIHAFKDIGVEVTDALVVFNKGSAKEQLQKELDINIKSMLDVKFNGEAIEVKDS